MTRYRVRKERLAPQPTAAIRVEGDPSRIADAMWEVLPEVGAYLDRVGVAPVGGPFARYFAETDDSIEFEGGFTLTEPVEGEGRIDAGELPGGPAAVTTHQGTLEDLEDAHDALEEWIAASGHGLAGPFWEVYVVGPGLERDPAKLHTDVVYPLRD